MQVVVSLIVIGFTQVANSQYQSNFNYWNWYNQQQQQQQLPQQPMQQIQWPGVISNTQNQNTVNTQQALGQCRITDRDAEGPYYTAGAPDRNGSVCINLSQNPLFLTGTIFGADCNTQLPNAQLDVWQADERGVYSGFDGDQDRTYRCRAIVRASSGTYSIRTAYPGSYPGRPRHLHARISAPGYQAITAQVYFMDDPLRTPGTRGVSCLGCQKQSLLVNAPAQYDASTGLQTRRGTWNVYLTKIQG